MSFYRLPRFERATNASPIQLTKRDREIIRRVHRHRFLRSSHIIALVGGSSQQILRRLQLLYHHGYLERPRAQLRFYERGVSREIVYGLGIEGDELVKRERGVAVGSTAWSERNPTIGGLYFEHALLESDIMVAIELACREHGGVRLLHQDELGPPQMLSQWQVKIQNGKRLSVIPDRVFALEHLDQNGQSQRVHYFLEADRGTMPVIRKNPAQTSFQRKLLAYRETWNQNLHRSCLGINRFRVLTITTIPGRVYSLIDACSKLESGRGLFLFADTSILSGNILSAPWKTAWPMKEESLLG